MRARPRDWTVLRQLRSPRQAVPGGRACTRRPARPRPPRAGRGARRPDRLRRPGAPTAARPASRPASRCTPTTAPPLPRRPGLGRRTEPAPPAARRPRGPAAGSRVGRVAAGGAVLALLAVGGVVLLGDRGASPVEPEAVVISVPPGPATPLVPPPVPPAGGPGGAGGGAQGEPVDVAGLARATPPDTAPPSRDVAGNAVRYEAANMLDGQPDTAWRMPGDATGQEVLFRLAVTHDDHRGGTDQRLRRRSTPATTATAPTGASRAVEWVFDDGTVVPQDLADTTRGVQGVAVGDVVSSTGDAAHPRGHAARPRAPPGATTPRSATSPCSARPREPRHEARVTTALGRLSPPRRRLYLAPGRGGARGARGGPVGRALRTRDPARRRRGPGRARARCCWCPATAGPPGRCSSLRPTWAAPGATSTVVAPRRRRHRRPARPGRGLADAASSRPSPQRRPVGRPGRLLRRRGRGPPLRRRARRRRDRAAGR